MNHHLIFFQEEVVQKESHIYQWEVYHNLEEEVFIVKILLNKIKKKRKKI